MSSSSTDPPKPRRIKRIAAKPLKLAASAVRPLTSRTSTSNNLNTSTSLTSAGLLDPASEKNGSNRKLKRADSSFDVSQVGMKAARGPRKPLDGEEPAAHLRVRVVKGDGLVARDRGNTSDPFVTLNLPPAQNQSTPHLKKTLNPVFPPDSSTFDFPIYLSMAAVVGGRGLEVVIWDKDMLRKEYMGELALPLAEWFPSGSVELWGEKLPVLTRHLVSSRRKQDVTGTISLQIGFLPPKTANTPEEAHTAIREVYQNIVDQSNAAKGLAGVLGVPAYKGIGTIKLRNRRRSDHRSTIGALSAVSATTLASMAGSNAKVLPIPPVPEDTLEDDEDSVSLADDGLSDSSSSEESDFAEDDRDETFMDLRESPGPMTAEDELQHQQQHAGQHTPHTPSHHHRHHHHHDHHHRDGEKKDTTSTSSGSDDTKIPSLASRESTGYFESLHPSQSTDDASPLATPGPVTPGGGKRLSFLRRSTKNSTNDSGSGSERKGKDKTTRSAEKKARKENKKSKKKNKDGYNFNVDSDVLGVVALEIKGAEDLPKLLNSIRLTYDMDPFVVISFGKKVFRTRVIRHSLNPVWDERLLFHVRRNETAFTIQFSLLDWDKISGNDFIGSCTLPLDTLVADAPKPGDNGLYGEKEDGKHDFKEFVFPIAQEKESSWGSKHKPKLTVRAKYEPYSALRQRFWRQYIAQYDIDETKTMSYTELTAMLDSLGSTLTRSTLEGFFKASGKKIEDELTIDEVVWNLENEVNKPKDEKRKRKVSKKYLEGDGETLLSGSQTPYSMNPLPASDGLGMDGPENISSPVDAEQLTEQLLKSSMKDGNSLPGNLRDVDESIPGIRLRKASMDQNVNAKVHGENGSKGLNGNHSISEVLNLKPLGSGTVTPSYPPSVEPSDIDDTTLNNNNSSTSSSEEETERVINIRTCPLCHRPRLGKRSEQDIITHLAICASSDWSRMDKIVTANYVTSSQAQRKFLTKMINKVTIGNYKLGANSANILVQDRMTGQLQEEKMAVYVRLGIRVLYKGWRNQMEGGRARRLLKSLSVKQGLKFDNPESAADILPFIAFHNLNVNEILDPLDSFKTFNQFFYRKLKPDARPVSEPGNEGRLVSCADCRMMAFESVEEATKIWIKGREFSVGRLLGSEYKDIWGKYDGGALAIFRLAPQDYHRFHSPVKGKVGKMTLIDGEYYTVNPQAIRTELDVYGENVRKVVPVHSAEFGTVMTVWVGAMMVGSIATTVEEGQQVERADELGYFAFGGSTIVCLFEKGMVEWDEDLLSNGKAAIETLVRMGMGIGKSLKKA